MRDLREELRQSGLVTGGPAPMTAKDRSRFLGKLDKLVSAAREPTRSLDPLAVWPIHAC
jgi:uncharacterized protein YaiI (UPF0178 family)